MDGSRRSGLTLLEVLVVIAITGVLVALLLPAVVHVHEAALRSQSLNNTRQIVLGVLIFADSHRQRLPTIDGTGPNSGASLHVAILPCLEQANTLARLQGNAQAGVPIPTYMSPADPTMSAGLDSGFLPSSYAANAQVFVNGPRLPSSIPDGTSNTMAFAEHYGYCNFTPFDYTIVDMGLNNWPHRADFADALDDQPTIPPLAVTYQIAPSSANCDPMLAQTPHTGGMIVSLFDGSARQISPGISPATYWGAVTPAGNEILSDW
jgi:prepilin-type N-terminal cleavage/methylation domain-containing protein